MIKTLVILVILAWLVVFGLVLALISTLDDLCEYEKKIKKVIEHINNVVDDNGRYLNREEEAIISILKGDDNDK